MKHAILSVIAVLLFATSVNARIIRVGFFGPPVSNVDFADLQLAINAASAGDTIYVFPGASAASTYYLTKKLTLIGYGNWLNPASTPKGNANQQAFDGNIAFGYIYFQNGSDGSAVMGFSGGYVYIEDADNVVIRRNRNLYVYLGYGTPTTNNNLQILENYRIYITPYTTPNYNFTNLNISNNFIWYLNLLSSNTYSGNIANNIWAYSTVATNTELNSSPSPIALGGGAMLLQNNIFASYTDGASASNYNYFSFTDASNSVFNYNVMIGGYNLNNFSGAGAGNVVVAAEQAGNIFEGFPTLGSRSADDRWALKTGSPALVAGRPGSTVNAGIYGGPNPYKLSTIPPIPTIYGLSSPDGNNPTGGSIQINVSTRGNN